MQNKVDIRMRIARQGLFSCLPYSHETEKITGTFGSHLPSGEDIPEYNGIVEYREDYKGSVKMWRTVIDRALLYALSPNRLASEEALEWFDLDNEKESEYFISVCQLAALSPEWVAQKAKDIYDEYKNIK